MFSRLNSMVFTVWASGEVSGLSYLLDVERRSRALDNYVFYLLIVREKRRRLRVDKKCGES